MSIVQYTTRTFVSIVLSLALVASLLPLSLAAQTGTVTPPPAEPLTTQEATELFDFLNELRADAPADAPFADITSPADILALTPEEQSELEFSLFFGPGPAGGSVAALDPALDICFDHYTFDSVDVSVQSQTTNVLTSGTEAAFIVTLTNTNPYPIVDTGLYLKLYRELAPGEATTQMHHLVDEWQALSDLSIPAGETITRDITYDIPAGVPTASYRLVGYVAVAEAYNLAGLPFTDDVFGGVYSFQINGEGTGSVAFDRSRTFVNQSQYYFAAFAPQLSATDPIQLATFLENTTEQDAQAEITWEVYRWDQQREEHRLSTETQTVAVAAGDTIPLNYSVTDTDYPVYLVAGTAQVGDMTSRINVRVVREGLTQTRLNFPGVMSYPLTAGEATTLFSCAHNTSNVDQVPGGRIELELTDRNGQTIHSHTYEGPITGAMMGTADTFTPERTYNTFTLTATLFQDNVEVESVTLDYNCTELGVSCAEESSTASAFPTLTTQQWQIIGALVVALILGGYFLYSRRRTQAPTDNSEDTNDTDNINNY
jgi:hypothetical protein